MSETIATTLDPREPQAPSPPGELALRIRGGDYHGRIVRIRANQCTIGSAPDCTLRLAGPGLRPLHCIIIRGEAGATVRRWSPDTQLNGRAFSDALLMAGDRLEIGPIELEVLDDADLPARRRPDLDSATNQVPVAELAGEIVSHLRQDLQRDKDIRRRKAARKRLVQSRRRIEALEAELEHWQSAAQSGPSAAGQATASQPQVETAPPDLLAERAAWDLERQSLLKRLDEKLHLEHRLEFALGEMRKAMDQEHLAAAAQREQENEELAAERQRLQERAAELDRLQAWCDNVGGGSLGREQEQATDNNEVLALHRRIAELEALVDGRKCTHEESDAPQQLAFAQQQLHDLFGQCEQLREQLTHGASALADARKKLADHDDALARQRERNEQVVAELQAQLSSQAQELAVALTARDDLRLAAEQSSGEWSQREQELMQRVECLERLASNLEDELRSAVASPDRVEAAEGERLRLEQQLGSAQAQWSEQRKVLEEQALSAHEQLQDMENQITSLQDALRSAHAQVGERDQLLSQLRDEVRSQLAVWQQEREELLQQLGTMGQTNGPSIAAAESNRCADEGHPLSEDGPPSDGCEIDHSELPTTLGADAPNCGGDEWSHNLPGEQASTPDGDVDNAMARLSAAGIWRNEETAPVEDPTPDNSPTVCEPLATDSVAQTDFGDRFAEETTDSADLPADDQPASETVATTNDGETAGSGDASAQPAVAAKVGDDDESIEAYMARLLKRVRGDAVASAFVAEQAVVAAASAPISERPVEHAPPPAQQTPVDSREFLPRKSAPEQAADVAAMREVAVQSTRQAINRSTQQLFQKRSLGLTLGACALVGVSVALFGWAFDTGNWLAWIGSGVCLVAGSVFLLRRLKLRARPKPLPTAEPSA